MSALTVGLKPIVTCVTVSLVFVVTCVTIGLVFVESCMADGLALPVAFFTVGLLCLPLMGSSDFVLKHIGHTVAKIYCYFSCSDKINGNTSHSSSLTLCTSPACPLSQAQLCMYKLCSSSSLVMPADCCLEPLCLNSGGSTMISESAE